MAAKAASTEAKAVSTEAKAGTTINMTVEELQNLIDARIQEEREKAAQEARKAEKSEQAEMDEAYAAEVARMNELIPVYVFKDKDKYKDDLIVSVNGKAWQIQRGVEVMVPRYVAEVIRNSQTQDAATEETIRQLEKNFQKANDAGML